MRYAASPLVSHIFIDCFPSTLLAFNLFAFGSVKNVLRSVLKIATDSFSILAPTLDSTVQVLICD